jgi:hypothetical protein
METAQREEFPMELVKQRYLQKLLDWKNEVLTRYWNLGENARWEKPIF